MAFRCTSVKLVLVGVLVSGMAGVLDGDWLVVLVSLFDWLLSGKDLGPDWLLSVWLDVDWLERANGIESAGEGVGLAGVEADWLVCMTLGVDWLTRVRQAANWFSLLELSICVGEDFAVGVTAFKGFVVGLGASCAVGNEPPSTLTFGLLF